MRIYVDNRVDTSEDRLDSDQDQGEENSVAEDLPTT
jgi:hypothetical protein